MTYVHKKMGSLYDPNLTTSDIIKLVRKRLKEKLPMLKLSVRKETYAGWSTIHIHVLEWLENYHLYTIREEGSNDVRISKLHLFVKEFIESIANEYNFNDSDPMTDYFSQNYFVNIVVDSWIEDEYIQADDIELEEKELNDFQKKLIY